MKVLLVKALGVMTEPLNDIAFSRIMEKLHANMHAGLAVMSVRQRRGD